MKCNRDADTLVLVIHIAFSHPKTIVAVFFSSLDVSLNT